MPSSVSVLFFLKRRLAFGPYGSVRFKCIHWVWFEVGVSLWPHDRVCDGMFGGDPITRDSPHKTFQRLHELAMQQKVEVCQPHLFLLQSKSALSDE